MTKLSISYLNIKGVEVAPSKGHSLNATDIIIYIIYLPNYIDLKLDLAKFLNSKEINRAERFYKELDKTRFIIYRSILKFILATYTKLDVKNINLNYHLNKKPYLASRPWLHFNISHSEDYAVIAVSRKMVGIDIEYMLEDFKFTDLLPDVFDDNEIATIQNAVNKKEAFYTLWTRKEAFVKALGKGIDEDFKYIPSIDGQHKINANLLKNSANWQLCSFDLADYYSSAIAVESSSSITNNVAFYTMPNTMKELLEMTRIRTE